MKIANLKAHNYRSIADITISCPSLLTLLGPNNHGKSNILSALEFGLSASKKPDELDFFSERQTNDDELWVEMTFHELTDQERNTFKRYVLFDSTVCIRKVARLTDGAVEVSYHGWLEEPVESWLRADNANNYTSKEKVSATPLNDLVPGSGRITKIIIENAQQEYIEQHRDDLSFSRRLELGPLLGQRNVAGGVLPEFFLIPAVRDLSDEMRIRNTTAFGRLMSRAVRGMASRDQRFMTAKEDLSAAIASLNERSSDGEKSNELSQLERELESALVNWGVKVNIEVKPPEIERIFELGTNIQLDDGVRTTADRKGHGLQRAMIIALLRSWAAALQKERRSIEKESVSARQQSESVIFAIEEPELFLHPHAQRDLAMSLREISQTADHQVFLCTHSTQFVDLDHYKEIAIVEKANVSSGSHVQQCTEELFEGEDMDDKKKRFHMAHWINPDRGEMFFARRVVFVEGETEKVVIPFLGEKMGLFDSSVSIIDCGSKYNLPLYMAIANAFSMEYLVVHDEDPVPDPIPDDWGEEKLRSKRRTFALNETIANLVDEELGEVLMMSPDIEGEGCVSRSQGKRKGKALASLDHFDGVSVEGVPSSVGGLVGAAYRGRVQGITEASASSCGGTGEGKGQAGGGYNRGIGAE